MSEFAEIAGEFMSIIDERLEDSQVTWRDLGDKVEIRVSSDDFEYSLNFKGSEEVREHEVMGEVHKALVDAIKEVEN
jgi:hypothetical protein